MTIFNKALCFRIYAVIWHFELCNEYNVINDGYLVQRQCGYTALHNPPAFVIFVVSDASLFPVLRERHEMVVFPSDSNLCKVQGFFESSYESTEIKLIYYRALAGIKVEKTPHLLVVFCVRLK